MRDKAYFRAEAAKCRRLAEGISNSQDPAVAKLLALADSYDALAEGYAQQQAASPDEPPADA